MSTSGKLLGKKDHTTIIHGVNKIEDELDSNPELSYKIEDDQEKDMCITS